MRIRLLIALACLAAAPAARGLEKKPVPDIHKQIEVEQTLRKLYKLQYLSPKISEKLDLAREFMRLAADPKEDLEARYVLWQQAGDLAAKCGDTDLAMDAIDALANKFNVNVVALKKETLLAAAKAAQTLDPDTSSAILAMRTLLEAPSDGDANYALGQYYCLVRNDWEKGLPHFSRCSHETFKSLADRELGKPNAGFAQMALGERWVDLADSETDAKRRENMRQHGAYWLKQALPLLTGLAKQKAEWSLKNIKYSTSMPPAAPKIIPFAIRNALDWLANNQELNGSWNSKRHGSLRKTDTACTALALLALVRAGSYEGFGPYQENIRRAIGWLEKLQTTNKADGHEGLLFDPTDEGGQYGLGYPHGMAGLALVEAAAASKNPDTRAAAQLAVNYSCRQHQDPEGGGFRYGPKTPGSLSVTCWYIQQLAAAKAAELEVDQASWDGLTKFLRSVTINDEAAKALLYGYMPGVGSSPQLTMMGAATKMMLGAKPEEIAPSFAWALNHMQPTWGFNGEKADLYYWYYGSLAANKLTASPAGRELAGNWNETLKAALMLNQEPGGSHMGSWPAVGNYASDWGRAGQTAWAALCLLLAQ
jgi:hypothetical protein